MKEKVCDMPIHNVDCEYNYLGICALADSCDICPYEYFLDKLENLLCEHGISIDDAVKIYKHVHCRLVQCHKDGSMWQYFNDSFNPCNCGSNMYHYEYDNANHKIYGVCNCCGADIYEVKKEFKHEKLKTGVWKEKE